MRTSDWLLLTLASFKLAFLLLWGAAVLRLI